jgi:serine phosphatase RsbU (regulator of sigma subunit)/methyl-accepting chemotaxis protein
MLPNTIRARLVFSFSSFAIIAILMIAAFFWFDNREKAARQLSDQLKLLNLKVERAGKLEKEFFISEAVNPTFYETGRSPYAQQHQLLMQELTTGLAQVRENRLLGQDSLRQQAGGIIADIGQFEQRFDSLVNLTRRRGFRSYGLEGEVQQSINRVVNSGYDLNLYTILSIRKLEKDYLIQKNDAYLGVLNTYVDSLRDEAQKIVKDPIGREFVKTSIEQYKNGLQELSKVDKIIGLQDTTGLRGELNRASLRIEEGITGLDQAIAQGSERLSRQVQAVQLGLLLILFSLIVLLGIAIHRSISRPLQRLSVSIREVVKSNFNRDKEIYHIRSKDELGRISRDFSFLLGQFNERTDEVLRQREELAQAYDGLEDLVEARTAEVRRQKQEIEHQKEVLEQSFKNVQLLSEIGRLISSFLSVEGIAEQAYASINQLMDADTFAIGVLQKESQELKFIGGIENNLELPIFSYKLDNDTSFAVRCVNQQRELFISDLLAEGSLAIDHTTTNLVDITRSLIYLPLIGKEGILGVITVQSFQPNAYSDYHLNILRNLAIYTSTALENANAYRQIELQKASIEQINNKINASLNYASRIQAALLPDLAELEQRLPESFVLFRPREIVSGDFYWFQEKNHRLFIAVADCTGVPGAFMSMIGHDLLNEMVNEKGLTDVGQILTLMHLRVRQALRQETSQNRDGMDIALCAIDQTNQQIEFAGAKSGLVYFQNGQLGQIKGNNSPVGGWQREATRSFDKHTVSFANQPTTFYLFSDGYKDQFGGPQNTKLTSKSFHKLLTTLHEQPMGQQRTLLDQALGDWMQDRAQLDDILVMGARVGA